MRQVTKRNGDPFPKRKIVSVLNIEVETSLGNNIGLSIYSNLVET